MKLPLILLVASVALSPLAHAATDQETIRAERSQQNAAIVAGKVDDIVSYWTDDVTICRGLGIQMAGKAAYRTLFESAGPSKSKVIYQREPSEIQVSPNWPLAFETGTWRGHLGAIDGPVVISGRYSAQWVKRDGRWLIRSEVFVAIDGAGAGLEYKAAP